MPYKDPEVRRAKAREINKKYLAANREKILAKGRERWPAYYAANREKRLAATRARADRQPLAGRPRPDHCEICAEAAGKKALHFDHSHQKGHFRGWICSNCNCALGLVNDDVQRLLKLVAYLQRTRENTSPQLIIPGI